MKMRLPQQEIEEYKRQIAKYDSFFGEENHQNNSEEEYYTHNGSNNSSSEGYYTHNSSNNNLRNRISNTLSRRFNRRNGQSGMTVGMALFFGFIFLMELLTEEVIDEDTKLGLFFAGIFFLVVIFWIIIVGKIKITYEDSHIIIFIVIGSIFFLVGLTHFIPSMSIAKKVDSIMPILLPLIFMIMGLLQTILTVYGTIVEKIRCTVEVDTFFCDRMIRNDPETGTSYKEFYQYTYMGVTYTKSIYFSGWLSFSFLSWNRNRKFYINPNRPIEVYYKGYPLQILSGVFITLFGIVLLYSFCN